MPSSSARTFEALRQFTKKTSHVVFLQRGGAPAENTIEAAVCRKNHMNNHANWAAVVAFFVGLGGYYLYTSRLAEKVGGGAPRHALILTQDRAPGQIIEEGQLGMVTIPSRYLESRRILAEEKSKVVGLVAERALHAGDGLIWADLRDGAAHENLAALVVPGHRAFSLPSKANSLGSLLHAGDHVDVLLQQAGKSEVILERVLVLTVGGRLPSNDKQEQQKVLRRDAGVILSVSPTQATQLLAAESRGDLSIILRNPGDEKKAIAPTVRVPQPRANAAPKVPEKKEIEHVR